jgi:hypothetical protein
MSLVSEIRANQLRACELLENTKERRYPKITYTNVPDSFFKSQEELVNFKKADPLIKNSVNIFLYEIGISSFNFELDFDKTRAERHVGFGPIEYNLSLPGVKSNFIYRRAKKPEEEGLTASYVTLPVPQAEYKIHPRQSFPLERALDFLNSPLSSHLSVAHIYMHNITEAKIKELLTIIFSSPAYIEFMPTNMDFQKEQN